MKDFFFTIAPGLPYIKATFGLRGTDLDGAPADMVTT